MMNKSTQQENAEVLEEKVEILKVNQFQMKKVLVSKRQKRNKTETYEDRENLCFFLKIF